MLLVQGAVLLVTGVDVSQCVRLTARIFCRESLREQPVALPRVSRVPFADVALNGHRGRFASLARGATV
jgi:hypothetical protein